ncbi:5469_t:CDS:2, partial [Acaulospora morrowiae]
QPLNTPSNPTVNDKVPIAIAISAFILLFFGSLLYIYVKSRQKIAQQKSLASAIIATEAATTPRYRMSTLQIEPMTKRLTLDLSQKGKCIVMKDDNDVYVNHVFNVVSVNNEIIYEINGHEEDGVLPKRSKKHFWK